MSVRSNKSIGASKGTKSTQTKSTQPSTDKKSIRTLNEKKSIRGPEDNQPVKLHPGVESRAEGRVDPTEVKGRCTGTLFLSVAAVAFGSSFIFGYNLGVINLAGATMQRWIADSVGIECANNETNCKNLSDSKYIKSLNEDDGKYITSVWSFVASLFPLGGMFGGLATGFIADGLGRKRGMLFNNILTFIGGGVMCSSRYANSYWILLVGRFIIGVNCGLNSGLAPMYLTEIAPVHLRGVFGSVNQLMVSISILLSNILGLQQLLGSHDRWPFLLLFTIVPSIFQLITFPFCPESPKFLLITKNEPEAARAALIRLRGTDKVDAEIEQMQQEMDKIKASPKVTVMDMFKHKILRKALCIAVMMMLAQQLSGVNAIMFFSNEIFESAQLDETAATGATIGVLSVNVVMTFVSTFIVDLAGRRTLMIISEGGMLLSLLALVVSMYLTEHRIVTWASYLSIPFIFLFIIFFATGAGSIPWFLVSELFEQGVRGNANSIAVGINWFTSSVVGLSFKFIGDALKGFSFLIFCGFLAIFLVFTVIFVPETKGKSVEQVMAELDKGKKSS